MSFTDRSFLCFKLNTDMLEKTSDMARPNRKNNESKRMSETAENLIKQHLNDLIHASYDAGALIMRYASDYTAVDVEQKKDGTPVTKVDQEAEDIILAVLKRIAPHIPIVAEEQCAAGNIPDLTGHDAFWLVDALDGTKEFISGTGEFTVNIALIDKGEPVFGVIYAPARGDLYYAAKGHGAYKKSYANAHDPAKREAVDALPFQRINVRPMDTSLTLVTSRRQKTSSQLRELFNTYRIVDRLHCGSSLKFCLIAEGKADIYPRLGPTSEWDTGAGDAILREAGGALIDMDNGGGLITYRKEDRKFLNYSFVAVNKDLWLKHKDDFKQPPITTNGATPPRSPKS